MKRVTPICTGLLAGLLFTFLAPATPAASIVEVSQPDTAAREMSVTLDRWGHATVVWTVNGSESTRPLQSRYESNGWQEWVNIESPGSNWNPRLAQADELTTAVWLSFHDGYYRVYGAGSFAGYWSQPQILSTPEPFWPAPTVAMDGQGCAIAAWSVEHGISSRHFCQGGWGPETSLTGDDRSRSPQLTANASGSVIAVWEQAGGSHHAIAMARYESGRWSAPEVLHQSSDIVARPQAVLDDRGNAVVAWEAAGANGTRLIQARQFHAGAWSPAVDLSSTLAMAAKPQLSMDRAGTVMAVWGIRVGDDLLVQSAYLAHGHWSPARTLGVAGHADNWGERGLPAPRIASMGARQFTAIWASYADRENTGAVNRASFQQGRWDSAEQLTTTSGFPEVDVAAQPDGQMIHVWNNSGVIQALSLGLNARLLSVKRSGAGRVTSNPGGIDCGEDCSASLGHRQRVELQAEPAPGARFLGWSGACSGKKTTCRVRMMRNRIVKARFER